MQAMEESIDESIAKGGLSLTKASRVGGPVTCVAFSPLDSSNREKSFFFVAQGPYLIRYGDTNQQEKEDQLLVFPEDKRKPRGGGTIHGIHFLNENVSTCWDALVYGGKRMAFCSLLDEDIARRNVTRSLEQGIGNSEIVTSPFMELDDWIWNVKTVRRNDHHNAEVNDMKKAETTMVVGFARHMIEVWTMKENEKVVFPNLLRRLFLDPPTVVTSMDFVFLKNDFSSRDSHMKGDTEASGNLWIAAGTSFHKIWISCVSMKEVLAQEEQDSAAVETSDSSILQHHLLKGHSGVVHSVRWFQDGDKVSLTSTSDDRSVRKWEWDDSKNEWFEKWVGWGHSARVWSISAVYSEQLPSSSVEPLKASPMLISVAEDGTARVWDSRSGEILACIHNSTTLWAVDTLNNSNGGKFIIGGTDGVSAIYNVCNHISGTNMLSIEDVPVPDDRPPPIVNDTPCVANKDQDMAQTKDIASTLTKKKKKAKKKIQSQVLVGVKCWRDGSASNNQSVIVSTRQGSLMLYDIVRKKWKTYDPWWLPSLEEKFGIHAKDGNSMAVYDGLSTVAIGTSRGDIILSSIQPGRTNDFAILSARTLRSVQGLTFLDSSCLVSFHVHSVAVWKMEFDSFPSGKEVVPSCVFNVETKGIPQSCAYDQVNQRFVIGDSRGNLAYFRIKNSDDGIFVHDSVLHRVHQKQHITSVKWLNDHTLLTAGNDGCLHVSYLYENSLQRGWSYPAPSLTGTTNIVSGSCPTIVAGYHGNTYRVLDVDSGYEYIRSDTGGRQRILDCNLSSSAHDCQLVVCKAQKDGTNSLCIQTSSQPEPTMIRQTRTTTKGVKLHGETIFESSFFTLTNQEIVFLVTASEDCSSRISAWKNGRVVDSVSLTPQESCCRCVAVSQIDDKSVLLVVGGGKLALQFFVIRERFGCTEVTSTKDLQIKFLGDGLTAKNGATIDHRINSISALPFMKSEQRSHLVIAGDSEGSTHAFIISEINPQDFRNPRGMLVPTTIERPVLCIKSLLVGERIVVAMGTTGGDIHFFDAPGSLPMLQDSWDKFSTVWNPIGTYQGHQMGTNTMSAEILSMDEENDNLSATLSIVTGGDDQALCVARVNLEQTGGSGHRLQLQKEPYLNVVPEASFSAIKGVSCAYFCGQRYLFAVGYSQQLSIWKFNAEDDMLLECTSRLPVDLGDVNCLAAYQSPDESTYLVAVCGMGVEIFQNGKLPQI